MDADAAKASHRRMLDQVVIVRRYSGSGPDRPHVDASARSRVTGYRPQELVGTITQGDRRVILYADDLIGSAIPSVMITDKIVVRGKELQIMGVDDSTRRVEDQLVAYELQVRG